MTTLQIVLCVIGSLVAIGLSAGLCYLIVVGFMGFLLSFIGEGRGEEGESNE